MKRPNFQRLTRLALAGVGLFIALLIVEVQSYTRPFVLRERWRPTWFETLRSSASCTWGDCGVRWSTSASAWSFSTCSLTLSDRGTPNTIFTSSCWVSRRGAALCSNLRRCVHRLFPLHRVCALSASQWDHTESAREQFSRQGNGFKSRPIILDQINKFQIVTNKAHKPSLIFLSRKKWDGFSACQTHACHPSSIGLPIATNQKLKIILGIKPRTRHRSNRLARSIFLVPLPINSTTDLCREAAWTRETP